MSYQCKREPLSDNEVNRLTNAFQTCSLSHGNRQFFTSIDCEE